MAWRGVDYTLSRSPSLRAQGRKGAEDDGFCQLEVGGNSLQYAVGTVGAMEASCRGLQPRSCFVYQIPSAALGKTASVYARSWLQFGAVQAVASFLQQEHGKEACNNERGGQVWEQCSAAVKHLFFARPNQPPNTHNNCGFGEECSWGATPPPCLDKQLFGMGSALVMPLLALEHLHRPGGLDASTALLGTDINVERVGVLGEWWCNKEGGWRAMEQAANQVPAQFPIRGIETLCLRAAYLHQVLVSGLLLPGDKQISLVKQHVLPNKAMLEVSWSVGSLLEALSEMGEVAPELEDA